VFGSVVALRQQRLKLLIAYSTLAQIGYLFLMFPLAFSAASAQLEAAVRWPAACCRRSPTPARRPPCSCRRD
jgi:NADH:ubiquinone oxidoreductase subunit 2 (subunit N)